MHYDLIGRKAILSFLGLVDWRQVSARMAKGCPVVREGGMGRFGRWLADSEAISRWIAQGSGAGEGAGGE